MKKSIDLLFASPPVTTQDENSADCPTEGLPDAEPCPTPLSTKQVFRAFEDEGTSWEVPGPSGVIRGQTVGSGPPMYFLNGLEGGSELFRLLVWILKDDMTCVVFDAPTPPTSRQTYKDVSSLAEVQNLFAVADDRGDADFHVYGTGLGGWMALAAAIAEPMRLRSAIVQGSYATRNFGLFEKLLLSIAKRSKRSFADVPGWNNVFFKNHRSWFPPFDFVRWEIFQELVGKTPVRDLAIRTRPLRTINLEKRLGEIPTPILCLETEGGGKVLHDRHLELTKALPNMRAESLENTGLVPHWTHPHRVAKLIRQFVADHESPVPQSVESHV